MQRALLERRVLLVGQPEGLADALDRDGAAGRRGDRGWRVRRSGDRGRQGPMNASNRCWAPAQTRCRTYTSWLSWLRPGANSRTLPARAKLREHPLRRDERCSPVGVDDAPVALLAELRPRTTSRGGRGRRRSLATVRACAARASRRARPRSSPWVVQTRCPPGRITRRISSNQRRPSVGAKCDQIEIA